ALVFALRRLVADQVLVLLAVRDDAVAELPESLRRIVSGHHGAVVRVPGLDEHELRDLARALGVASLPSRAARRLRDSTRALPGCGPTRGSPCRHRARSGCWSATATSPAGPRPATCSTPRPCWA